MLLAAAVVLSFGSCSKERFTGAETPGSDAGITLRFKIPGNYSAAPTTTRALTVADENAVSNINVLVFNNTGKLAADIIAAENVNISAGSSTAGMSGEGTFTARLPKSANATDTYTVVVLANADYQILSSLGGFTLAAVEATIPSLAYADIMAAIRGAITGPMYTVGAVYMPMWGESVPVELQPGVSIAPIVLMRAIARIDVAVAETILPALFELTSVYVIRANKTYAVVPSADNRGTGTVTAPTIPNTALSDKFTLAESQSLFAYNVTGGNSLVRTIYTPEANVVMGGTSGDTNHTDRMALVVGGKYNGSTTETFYRLDFIREGALLNVLRNYIYSFAIVSVTGAGYTSVETAYNSAAMNMEAKIYDWNDGDTDDIFIDGPDFLTLRASDNSREFEDRETRMAVVYRNANSTDKINFHTNIPFSEFTLALNNGGALPDSGNPLLIENSRFRAEIKTGTGGETFFEFTALQDHDPGATDNPSVLTVTTKRITFTITIVQRTNEKNDWIDGGDIDQDF